MNYVARSDIILNVDANYGGSVYTPATAMFKVTGPGDVVIQDWSGVPGLSSVTAGSFLLTIPAACNTLTAPATLEGRLIEIITTAPAFFTGSQKIVVEYVIAADASPLILMTNSFQTYTDSIARASTLGSELESWSSASMDDRVAAMATAYNFLSRLNYEIYYDYDDVYFKSRASWGLPYQQTVGRLYAYSPDQFLALDPDFIECIRKAQIVEADVYLTGDTLSDLRDTGVIMKKIAETEIQFRGGKPSHLMVSKKALKYMSGYIKYNIRSTRS